MSPTAFASIGLTGGITGSCTPTRLGSPVPGHDPHEAASVQLRDPGVVPEAGPVAAARGLEPGPPVDAPPRSRRRSRAASARVSTPHDDTRAGQRVRMTEP